MSHENPKQGRSKISALVLAAGSSQRMGRPKQLLPLGETTLLGHVLTTARQANVDEIVLVLGFAAEEIQQQIPTSGLKVVINQEYRRGMGTSLRMGLSATNLKTEGALVILADQPLVQAATLSRMIEYHHSHSPQIVIPLYKGFRGNPVLLDRSVFAELKNLNGDVGCRAIFGSHAEQICKLSVDDPGILLDVDTPDDFHKLEALPGAERTAAGLLPRVDLEEGANRADQSLPELVIVGRDAVAVALVRFGRMLRFRTTLVDPFLRLEELPEADRILHRLDFSLLPVNPDGSIVVASRGQFDEEALEHALLSQARYVGLMAGRSRCAELIGMLKKKGLPEENLNRLRAPAGLDIKAESAEEIALSIIGQIVSERRQSTTV